MKTILMLDCYPYPEHKPNIDGVKCICQHVDGDFFFAEWDNDVCAFWDEEFHEHTTDVIAWAEMPESLTGVV